MHRKKKKPKPRNVTIEDPAFTECVNKAKDWHKGFGSLVHWLKKNELPLTPPAERELKRVFIARRALERAAILGRFDGASMTELERGVRTASTTYERRLPFLAPGGPASQAAHLVNPSLMTSGQGTLLHCPAGLDLRPERAYQRKRALQRDL